MAFAPTEVLRILFVVSHGAKRAALSGNAGFLVVNASETKSRSYIDRNRSSVTGSFTAYFKLVAFLRHKAPAVPRSKLGDRRTRFPHEHIRWGL